MSLIEIVLAEDRAKADFLADYRACCEKHGFFVIHIERPENEYSPFALIVLNKTSRPVFEAAMQEMLLEPAKRIAP